MAQGGIARGYPSLGEVGRRGEAVGAQRHPFGPSDVVVIEDG